MMRRTEGCSSPPSYLPPTNMIHCRGSTLIPYLEQKREAYKHIEKHGKRKEETLRSLLSSPVSPFQFYLRSHVKRVSTLRHGSKGKGVVINVCLRRDALHWVLEKKKKEGKKARARRGTEKGGRNEGKAK